MEFVPGLWFNQAYAFSLSWFSFFDDIADRHMVKRLLLLSDVFSVTSMHSIEAVGYNIFCQSMHDSGVALEFKL